MPMVVAVLEQALENVFKTNVPNATAEQTAQIVVMATAMSAAIDAYIRTATVTVVPGTAVQVTPTTGTGATIASGIGTIT